MKSCSECGAIYANLETTIGIEGVESVEYCKFDGTELCPN